jgi:hypothetical protein
MGEFGVVGYSPSMPARPLGRRHFGEYWGIQGSGQRLGFLGGHASPNPGPRKVDVPPSEDAITVSERREAHSVIEDIRESIIEEPGGDQDLALGPPQAQDIGSEKKNCVPAQKKKWEMQRRQVKAVQPVVKQNVRGGRNGVAGRKIQPRGKIVWLVKGARRAV